ncbi:hypothetical protein [Brevibacterium jeotgali]|uniref:Uncharacterized protein n=1 Tax=Brevibacterium jeotgali TaxID=1262550 RepID=A0A2H1L422_9MICO|nr:hypothetical protein [Brevibacterium jeotgali]TWB98769.1 hypothetical protein FB108_2666 [Brevibacterium jeotgali]SMY11631.1 hypothetical protein BJEO58_01216 [Brevibacterium jeotgali]
MDTSIAFLLLAAVLFAVIVPAILKRSAERHEERLPDRAQTVEVDRTPRCTTDASRPHLLRGGSHPAGIDLPVPGVETSRAAPQLSLRTEGPALEVVGGSHTPRSASDGSRDDGAETDAHGPPGWESDAAALPMAVGQSAPLDLSAPTSSAVRSATGTADVLAFAPAGTTVVASAGSTGSTETETMDLPMNSSHRPAPRRVAAAAERMPSALPADIRARLAQPSSGRTGSGSSSHPSPGGSRPHTHHGRGRGSGHRPGAGRPTMDASARKRVRTLRAVLPFCGLAVIGLALLTLVFVGFVVFGSMPWGVPVVTAALGLASLGLVRALNREIRVLRRGMTAEADSAPRARATSPERPASTVGRMSTVDRARPDPQERAAAPTAARTAIDVDDPITADIPIVRDAAAAGDAQAEADAQPEADAQAEAEQTDAERDSAEQTEAPQTDSAQARTDFSEADRPGPDASAQPTVASRTRSVFAASALPEPEAPTIAESLARRRAPGEWTPTALPTPTYVDAPVAERDEPSPVVADASSYSLAPTNHESLAAQFAEELGYRPALADAARDESVRSTRSTTETATGSEGPLGHGRAAIRGSGSSRGRSTAPAAEQPPQLGDILARRRA